MSLFKNKIKSKTPAPEMEEPGEPTHSEITEHKD